MQELSLDSTIPCIHLCSSYVHFNSFRQSIAILASVSFYKQTLVPCTDYVTIVGEALVNSQK